MRKPLVLLMLCVFAGWSSGQTVETPEPAQAGESVSDFGFWTGSWVVQNTRFDIENQVYVDAGVAEASVEMLLQGTVVLERWNGTEGAIASTFGITLAYWDEERGRWVTLQCWPGGEPTATQFTRVEGGFAEGVIALHPARVFFDDFELAQFHSTRSVFGDVSDDSFRRLYQRPTANRSWDTAWALDYLRTSQAASDGLRVEPVPSDGALGESGARIADWMVGEWAGAGVEIQISSVLRGLGFVASVKAVREGEQFSSVLVVVWDESTETWRGRELGLNRPLKSLVWETVGRFSELGMVLRSKGAGDRSGMVFRRLEGDAMQFELTLPDGGRLDVELSRP